MVFISALYFHFFKKMLERYRDRGYPQQFNVRTKCILLFQTIHGVDVLIFGMYVYEYGHNCPPPNQRRVYISYLDSVNFFQPSEYRTFTYHTILIEYLRYVKSRGFHTAHIWACPAWDGDDFIFHIHPPHQKTTREDILCSWYQAMLATAEAEGVVIQTKTLYDEYFKTDKDKIYLDPTCIPYFDSDYIPGEIESIIKDLKKQEQGKQKEKCDKSIITKSKEKLGGKKKRSTRSNPNLIVHLEPDIVMKRLGHTLSQIKRNFFVVYLRSRAFAEAADRGEDISTWTELDDEKHKAGDVEYYDRCDDFCTENTSQLLDIIEPSHEANGDKPIGTTSPSNVPISCNEKFNDAPPGTGSIITSSDLLDVKCSLEATSLLGDEDNEEADADTRGTKAYFGNALARNLPPTQERIKPDMNSHSSQVVQTFIGSTIDVDPMINNDIFETRQQFLHFCRTNQYQFDELRRAKHSSMMVCFLFVSYFSSVSSLYCFSYFFHIFHLFLPQPW
jgi:E1A/CREB-binding protein